MSSLITVNVIYWRPDFPTMEQKFDITDLSMTIGEVRNHLWTYFRGRVCYEQSLLENWNLPPSERLQTAELARSKGHFQRNLSPDPQHRAYWESEASECFCWLTDKLDSRGLPASPSRSNWNLPLVRGQPTKQVQVQLYLVDYSELGLSL